MIAALRQDSRGAVMTTGVFMGSFLIGATWLIFGTARAAVFRERVQETADAAAFSSAALHAKGMNLIAAINLVMFAIAAIWLVLRTVEHVLAALQTSVLGNSSNCHGFACHARNPCEARAAALAATGVGAGAGASWCNVAYAVQEVRDVNKEARQRIGDAMDRFFPPLSRVQDVTARLAPAAGMASSVAIGARFGHFTVSLSPSLIPVADLGRAAGFTGENVEMPLGLPVIARKFGYLCNRTSQVVLNKVVDAFRSIPLLGEVVDLPVISNVIDGFVHGASNWVEGEFCSDNDWAGHSSSRRIFGEKGPKGMFGHAENGSDHLQIWTFTRGEIDDRDAPKVAIAGRVFNGAVTHHSAWYTAQAEFYFDCNGGWADGQCNGPTDDVNTPVDNAMYNMKWRARLRRLRAPNPAAELGRYLRDAVFSGPVRDAMQEAAGLGPRGQPGGSIQDSIRDGVFDQAWGFLNGAVSDGAGINNQATGGTPEGSYH